MPESISRRKALVSGAAVAGAALSAPESASAAQYPMHEIGMRPFWGPAREIKEKRKLSPGPTPIRLAMNIKRQGNESPGEMIRRRREEGYTAIKGARHPGGNKGEPWHSMSAAERREVVDACKQHDVVIYEVGGYTNLVHPDEDKRRKNLKALAHCVEVAESVNCAMVGTVAGCHDDKYLIVPHPENWSFASWKLLVDNMKQVLKDTAGMKAVIGMEAQVTTAIDSPEAHKKLMEDVGDERLKVNLDPNNMMSLATYFHSTELYNRCFDILGEDIYGCHAKDTLIIPDRQTVLVQELCPGKGIMDYETYLLRMSHLKWPRALEPEHIPDEEYPEAIAYIKQVAEKVGVTIYGE